MTWMWMAMLGCGWWENVEVPLEVPWPRPEEGRENGRRKPRPGKDFVRAKDPCAAVDRPMELEYAFAFDGKKYEMPLFVGASEGPREMMVLLHGGGGGPPSILRKTRLHDKALDEGFVAVAPWGADIAGKGERWNSGKFDKLLPKGTPVRDDVAFLDALTAALRKDLCVDEVYAFGFSSGGQMANRWACEGKQVDGVVAAAGSLLVPAKKCRGPKPILAMVGTEDGLFRHGPREDDPDQLSTPQSLKKHWTRINRCKSKSRSRQVGDASCSTYEGCKAPTTLCIIDGMGHDVPSPFAKRPTRFHGPDFGWDHLRDK